MTTDCGFELLREQTIPELNTRAILYRHTRTGAELLTLVNDDENKTFGAAFRTLPPDSTGVPHIIEHSVLGGSHKYPVKEPFVELIKGSLATFINAFTRPDSTIYPVASQNLQDLYNLMDVYLDAVFHPVLARHTFEQEGWHYELADVSAPLAYRGIVFNEMKGAMATPERAQLYYGLSALLPDTDYAWNSGGNPQNIPDLTYEGFRNFYATYYHPSNRALLPLRQPAHRRDALPDRRGAGRLRGRAACGRGEGTAAFRCAPRRQRPLPGGGGGRSRQGLRHGKLGAAADRGPRRVVKPGDPAICADRLAGLAAAQGADRFGAGRRPHGHPGRPAAAGDLLGRAKGRGAGERGPGRAADPRDAGRPGARRTGSGDRRGRAQHHRVQPARERRLRRPARDLDGHRVRWARGCTGATRSPCCRSRRRWRRSRPPSNQTRLASRR